MTKIWKQVVYILCYVIIFLIFKQLLGFEIMMIFAVSCILGDLAIKDINNIK